MTQTGQKRDGHNRKSPVNTELFRLKYEHIIIKIQKNTNGWLLTCMGSQVRVLYCPPSSRTKKDIYAKNPEVSTASGFFCAHFLKLEKKISKRVLAKSVDLNLYPRDFGPLFREFFGKAALFCSRQNVEFRPAFLLVLPNTHSKHRYQRVSQLCDVSDVKTAGKPPPASGRNHSVLAMLGREKANLPLRWQREVVYLLALSRASVFNVTPIMSLWASRVSRQSGNRKVNAF